MQLALVVVGLRLLTLQTQPTHPLRQVSINTVDKSELADDRAWIWTRRAGEPSWRRLIPGYCPQWTPDGKRFYFFMSVGYDGSRAELWSANPDGEARWRMTRSDYFIADGPILLSPDNRALAYVYRTSRAAGDFSDVVVINLDPYGPTDGPADARVVFRTHSRLDARTLHWSTAAQLVVSVDGVDRTIDATAKGIPQDP
jgi:hypothetical protein